MIGRRNETDEVEGFLLELKLAVLNLGIVEQIIDDHQQMLTTPLDDLKHKIHINYQILSTEKMRREKRERRTRSLERTSSLGI